MKRLLIAISILLLTMLVYSQSPTKMSYQAVIRNASGELVKNSKIGMQISLLQGSENGTVVYIETHILTTNINGLVSLVIGGGQVVSGNFTTVDWSNGPFFIKTNTDPTGGSNYTITSATRLISVPYTFYAQTAESLAGILPETDLKYSADSSFIKRGVNDWSSSLAKTIDSSDTTRWGIEIDQIYKAWNKSDGINITENQISDLDHFTIADEMDPKFAAWNKSTGITIKENQITDLHHFSNNDETDPIFSSSVAKGISSSDTSKWNYNFSGKYQDLKNRPTDLGFFNNDLHYQLSQNDGDVSATNEIQYIYPDVGNYKIGLTQSFMIFIPDFENDPVFRAWDKSTGIRIAESQISNLKHFTNANEIDPRYTIDSSFIKTGVRNWNRSLAKTINTTDTTRWGKEPDPIFSAWNKSTGITITESQITNLKHFTTADEIDPRYRIDSSFIKTGARSWNSSLAKTIDATDTTHWGRPETDPIFSAWNRSTGIAITESQITDLDHFTTADEIDPKYTTDSSFIKTGVRSWNSSLAKTIDSADTTWWGRAETDPFYNAWDKHTGIAITESQITNLKHFTTADEIDPKYATDSSFIKTGTRSWNGSLARTIDVADTTHWGNETDPLFTAWDRSTGIAITESQITDLDHFTTADEIDPRYAADSSFIKTGVRSWNNSLAKTIDTADTTWWGRAETDPVFTAWDKSTGITITENQITNLKHFTTADEIDPRYSADSSFLKTGVREWNSSLAKTIDPADTTWWGRAETDPTFTAWDRSTGIAITESQITDLDHFTTADEIDPKYAIDSSFIKTGVRSWNSSLARTIDVADTIHWGSETDPVFNTWDRSTGIAITESQITNLKHFTNTDEKDPKYTTDSSFIKTGVRGWNKSVAKTITPENVDYWNNKVATTFNGNYSNLTNAPDIALSTNAKTIPLTTGGTFQLNNGANTYLTVKQSTGLVGIGTNATDPRAQLEIGGTDGLLVRGTVNSGTIRALGAGLRMHWYPRKGAFRVGNAETSYWDDDGTSYPKMALYSVGMGYQPRASGVASNAIGAYNQATGDYALSLGSYSQATASHAVAIGTQAYATGIYSFAFGSGANTYGRDGSMVVGDDAYFQTAYSSADNQLTMRFIGGYRLWSSYPDSVAGVYMRHGQSGWSAYCDRNKKTNFKKLDFEEVLKKIDKIPVPEWNYKGNDTMKYIGPMAQDFYAAFHLGGTDSLGISTICIDGVNMAAIKGLIERTDELNATLAKLNEQKEKVAQYKIILRQRNEVLINLKKELTEIKAEISKYAIKNNELVTEKLIKNEAH